MAERVARQLALYREGKSIFQTAQHDDAVGKRGVKRAAEISVVASSAPRKRQDLERVPKRAPIQRVTQKRKRRSPVGGYGRLRAKHGVMLPDELVSWCVEAMTGWTYAFGPRGTKRRADSCVWGDGFQQRKKPC
jgi:hypothetical protein